MPDRTEDKPSNRTCPTCGRPWPGDGQGPGDGASTAQAAREAAEAAQGLSREVSTSVQGVRSQMKALNQGLGSVRQYVGRLGAAEAGR